MADKMRFPLVNPDGSESRSSEIQEIGTLIEVTDSKEPWSEYTLGDGTKIRLKQTVVSIAKLDGKQAQNGDPVYVVQHSKRCP
jgi:hypothetical protein